MAHEEPEGAGIEEGDGEAYVVDPDGNRLGYGEWEGPNGPLLTRLMDQRRIPVEEGENAFLYTERPPMPKEMDWGRIEGMMLGLAVGDALGKGSEGMVPKDRRAAHGEIRDYLRLHEAGIGDGRGYPSDDTQMAFWTLEQMVEDGAFDPERLANKFCSSRIYGIGKTVTEFIRCRKTGTPWYRCGQPSAGNGALMRIAPMLIPHLRSTSPDLWAETVLSTVVTHNDRAAIASSVAFVDMLWRLLRGRSVPEPDWWLESFLWVARDLDAREEYRGAGQWAGYRGRFSDYLEERVGEAYRRGLSVVDACDSWHSGAYLMQTVPCVLYILMKHGGDPEEAIVRAVNDTYDNDTVAAIVGAAVGALHGKSSLPERWLSRLSGRTREDDDGRVFELLERARGLWWPEGPRGLGAAPDARIASPDEAAGSGDERGSRAGGTGDSTRDGSHGREARTARRSLDHFAGCLLGGAVGDALGAPVEFIRSTEGIRSRFGARGVTDYAPAYSRDGGAITDDTQMTLFTAEGLIRAQNRFEDRGLCHPPTVIYHAYLRWLSTQGERVDFPIELAAEGWLLGVPDLHDRRAPGNSCLAALRSSRMGTMEEPINDSKGCGGVMRVAPVGLVASDPFKLGCEAAAITHGHPSGYLAAGFFASVVGSLMRGAGLGEAVDHARDELATYPGHEECLGAVDRAVRMAKDAPATAESVEVLGQGWVAEEALAITLFCALKAEDFRHGVLLAVNHAGDSDSTGSMTGNLLGLIHGRAGIPQEWLDRLELREVIEELAADLWRQFGEGGSEAEPDWDKYPPC